MDERIVASGCAAQPQRDAAAAANLHLLARWLLDCHERTRQRGQLGVLAPMFGSALGAAEPGGIDGLHRRREPAFS